MGASVGGNNRFVSEINVTPFVDVMLVLLIIFMVATPMMSQGQIGRASCRERVLRLV